MASTAVRVWDLPTRLFHWSLVFLFFFSWWSVENHQMEWHYRSGIALVGLLIFRLIWGVIGGSTARFAHFVRHPGEVFGYVRGRTGKPRAGHNPLGGYSVLALLILLVTQVTTGLLATDTDGLESGPLSYLLDFDRSRMAAEIHEVSFNILLALVGLHILAILYYALFGRHNLVRPMLTGKDSQLSGETTGLVSAHPIRFVIAAVIAFGLMWWISTGLKL